MGSTSCSRNSSFAFFLIFFIFFVVAFATPYWTEVGDVNYGIWQVCADGLLDDDCYSIGDVDDEKFNATRAMMCMSLICQIVSFVMYCVWVSKDQRYLQEHGAGPVGKSALSLALIGGLFNLIAVCIYGSEYSTSYLEWSFGFACTTTCVLLLNSTITLCVTACCYDGTAMPPPATTATMTVITTTQPQPAAVYYPPQQQPMGVYQAPQGGVSYAAPPPAGYPGQPQGAYPAQQYYQQQPVVYPQQQLPPYSPQYIQQQPVASAPPEFR